MIHIKQAKTCGPLKKKKKKRSIWELHSTPWSSPPSRKESSLSPSMVQEAYPWPAVPVTGWVDFT